MDIPKIPLKAKVLGRAGKATGKNKHWHNIQEDASKEKKSLNLEQVQWELINDDETVNIVMKQNSVSDENTAAKLVELQKLNQFHTYEEVKDCGQQTLSTRWVITNRGTDEGKACGMGFLGRIYYTQGQSHGRKRDSEDIFSHFIF